MGVENLGNFNSEYESYYSKIIQNKSKPNGYNTAAYSYGKGYTSTDYGTSKSGLEYVTNKVIRDLIGVSVLLFIVILCKTIKTPQTVALYTYSKNIVNTNYDYKATYSKLKSLNINELKEKAEDYMENIRAKLFGGDTLKAKINKEFDAPAKGEITSIYGMRKDPFNEKMAEHHGIDIDLKEGSEIKSAYTGKVKHCGEDEMLGKYIVIDHGEGVETKYAHLQDTSISEGDNVEKGQVIGKSGNTGKSTAPHLHFELIYMGQNKDPLNYINESLFKN